MSLKLRQIESIMDALYDDRKSLHMIGAPGTAKSMFTTHTMTPHFKKRFDGDFGLVVENLTSIDAVDIGGFCIPTKDAAGKPTAVFTTSAIAQRIIDTGKSRGILFLDEFSQSDHIVQKAAAPIILEGRIGNTYIPSGWWVVMASNRVEDRAGVNRPLSHLVNRQREIHMEVDLDDLAKYYEANGMHPMGVAFLKYRPGVVITHAVPTTPGPYCTPRSYFSTMKLLGALAGDSNAIPDDIVTQELVQGDVGRGVATEMFSFFKVNNRIPTKEDIMKDPMKAKLPKPEELDAQYAVMQLCIHHADKDNIDKLFTYVRRLNLELQTSACKSLLEKNSGGGNLLNSKALSDFISEHRTLIVNTLAN